MFELKLSRIGNSLATSWPEAALAHMKAKEGDILHVVETPQGLLVTLSDPKFAKTMKAAERVIHRYRNAYRELSKK